MVNIGCGSIILRENNSVLEVLLIERINTKTFNNLWSNPGGMKELDESLKTACIRENKEEIGVESKIIRKISTYLDVREGKLFGRYTGFLTEIISGTPTIMEPHKIKTLEYFPLNKLPENLAPYTRQYLRDLKF